MCARVSSSRIAQLALLELSDREAPPAIGRPDDRGVQQLEHWPLAEGVRDHLGPAPRRLAPVSSWKAATMSRVLNSRANILTASRSSSAVRPASRACQAGGDVGRLKGAVQRIAATEGVAVDALANYLAYRLSLQDINWWGAATNLQPTDANPWAVARNVLLEHMDVDVLNDADRQLLLRALAEE